MRQKPNYLLQKSAVNGEKYQNCFEVPHKEERLGEFVVHSWETDRLFWSKFAVSESECRIKVTIVARNKGYGVKMAGISFLVIA